MIPSERTRRIIKAVAEHYGVPVAVVLGPDTHRVNVRARQAAQAAVWIETNLSLPQVGRYFRRDHTTVLHSIRKTGAWPARMWPPELQDLKEAVYKDL